MHRTSGTILATSRNKLKHLSLPHYFTQARGYNTRTNPLPLLHTGKKRALSTASHRRKSLHWVPRYGKPHTTFNSIKSFQARQNTPNMQHMRITYCQQSTYHHIMHGKIKFHQQHINLLTNTFKNELNE